jgi:hypothetical protein
VPESEVVKCLQAVQPEAKLQAPEKAWKQLRHAAYRLIGKVTWQKPLQKRRIWKMVDRIGLLQVPPYSKQMKLTLEAGWKRAPPSLGHWFDQIWRLAARVEPLWRLAQLISALGWSWQINDDAPGESLVEALHYAFLLEMLVSQAALQASARDESQVTVLALIQKVTDSLNQKRREYSENTFQWLKMVSVQDVIKSYVEEEKNLFRPTSLAHRSSAHTNVLQETETCASGFRIALNILEAAGEDLATGHRTNAQVGRELAQQNGQSHQWSGPWRDRVQKHYSTWCYSPFPVQWCDLYLSWNLCFVANNFQDTLFYFAKLLIPSVLDYQPIHKVNLLGPKTLDADQPIHKVNLLGPKTLDADQKQPDLFMIKRVIALQLHITTMMALTQWRTQENRTHQGTLQVYGPGSWQDERINHLWAQINLLFAQRFQQAAPPSVGKTLSRAGSTVGWTLMDGIVQMTKVGSSTQEMLWPSTPIINKTPYNRFPSKRKEKKKR